ncbi:kinase-like protein [Sistotremastrum suecicum HHB10207 ss-3]|uniref:Kinase-like protein n=1 Tax=Sistotremastrum suecicum HHB10207 ss-3 TaxID=1314776 RepID=A0A166H7E7_9AGAM|nr:kinase-like protein [Sistotremastrum suecicum HHB10207 ss-3]
MEEVNILAHLAKEGPHPNVLKYVDSWEENERLFIQTELCELGNFGHFLHEYGRRYERLDEGRCWKVLAELSSGLAFVHKAGVLHLDVKPSNIFLKADGRFQLGDFGMASFWPRDRAGGFEREGDRMYLAAEVLQGVYGPAADVFSLGMTLLESAANIEVPEMGEPWHRLREGDFSQVGLRHSSTLCAIIRAMMHPDPARRPTAQEVGSHRCVRRAGESMAALRKTLERDGARDGALFAASALAKGNDAFVIGEVGDEMDCA